MTNSFLMFEPSIFVVRDRYVLTFVTNECGLLTLDVDGKIYYEENCGVLATNKNHFKIEIPQSVLDNAGEYTVCFRELIERKSYFSLLKDEERDTFTFKPLKKTENIKIYHLADVHCRIEEAKKCAAYFGDDLDVLILNGDITEVNALSDYYDLLRLSGDVTHGSLPILFSRGNHDTRGKLAEICNDYYPCANGKNYFEFSVGALSGVVLDCGEDKLDHHAEYGGVNAFEPYRREETEFLRSITDTKKNGTFFAISHCCPLYSGDNGKNVFNIEQDVYSEWNAELERLGTDFMICGHLHRKFYIMPQDGQAEIEHDYPIVIGSEVGGETLWGTAIVLGSDGAKFIFTDSCGNTSGEKYIKFNG